MPRHFLKQRAIYYMKFNTHTVFLEIKVKRIVEMARVA